MFAELSSKWLCCNPLEKPTAVAPSLASLSESTNIFAQSQPATSKQQSTSTSPFATTSSPFTTDASKSNLKQADAGSSKDYHKLLTEFYQKHNPQKVPEVDKNLEKYKVRIRL